MERATPAGSWSARWPTTPMRSSRALAMRRSYGRAGRASRGPRILAPRLAGRHGAAGDAASGRVFHWIVAFALLMSETVGSVTLVTRMRAWLVAGPVTRQG